MEFSTKSLFVVLALVTLCFFTTSVFAQDQGTPTLTTKAPATADSMKSTDAASAGDNNTPNPFTSISKSALDTAHGNGGVVFHTNPLITFVSMLLVGVSLRLMA